jgi:sugar transferase (PEP-CTERM/EpsH1 system associated)
MDQLVKGTLNSQKIDRIFVYSSAMAEYVRDTRGVPIPRAIDFVDVDSEKWRTYAERCTGPSGWIYRIEAQRLARYEEYLVRTFDHSIVTSEREAWLLRQRVPDASISVISNGVELEYFDPSLFHSSSSTTPTLIFTGTMDYLPNVDGVRFFCREIFPLVRQVMPDVVFYIVGRNPTREVKSLSQEPNVVVTGSVPDVRPYLSKSWLAVAPLRIARGVQNKVLEAMAMGLPVVGTPQAFQGAQACDSDGIRQANEPERFAQEILALLKDNTLRREASASARKYVERHHRWQDHGVALDRILGGSEKF